MKIPAKYGGLGFTNVEYNRVMTLVGSYCGNLGALLSAHQSIGVAQPLKTFGTEELKKKYLPRCAAGEISAFALTEPGVGSDPARMLTTAVKTPDGAAYVLNGKKLWTTNGTLAKLLVVMAMDPGTKKISTFVVEADWPGVSVEHRCRFMGLRAISNAVMEFKDVRVPAANLIGQEGKGLKIALTTLNDGRLSIPNISVGTVKACLGVVRRWSNERVQWGKPIGKHEAITHKISDIAARTFAMEAVASLATEMSDRGGYDIRLEAAAAKEWNTYRAWEIVDETMQIRGGRGYETEQSLAARGDEPVPVERIMRDYRINKIFEGSTEIMHLFMAREMVDKHLQIAGAFIDAHKPLVGEAGACCRRWRPSTRGGTRPAGSAGPTGRSTPSSASSPPTCASSSAPRGGSPASSFHGMLVYQAKLQNKQAFLFRLVDIANETFAMAAAVTRAKALADRKAPEGAQALRMADVFCRSARRRVKALFRELWSNDDVLRYKHGLGVLSGADQWLEAGIMDLQAKKPAPVAEKAEVPVGV